MTVRKDAGFTLLEVMAALTVFLIGVMGVLSLFSSGTRLHHQAQRESGALDLAEELVLRVERELPELLQGDPRDGLSAELQPVPDRPPYQFSYELQPVPGGSGYLLTLQIVWREGGQRQQHEVRQLLGDPLPPARRLRRNRAAAGTAATGG